ncbi:MAG TPA: hypothetical protein ENI95_07545, partial [Chloroflexi bacterium]|nr:hypothetical protein [Chloroflexota bacterium]
MHNGNAPPPEPAIDRRVALALSLLLLSVYLLTSSLGFHSIDEVSVFSVTRSLTGHGTFDANILYWTRAALGTSSVVARGIDGHIYSVKDVGSALLAVPLVWLAHALGTSPVRAALMLSPLLTALTGGLLYLTLVSWGYNRPTALLGGLTFGLATLAWPYAETLFTQPLAALGLLIALRGVVRAGDGGGWQAALTGGLGLGLAGIGAVPVWVSAPVYPLYLISGATLQGGSLRMALKRTWPLLLAFGLGAGVFAAGQGAYNWARFGSPFETGYQQIGVVRLSAQYLGVGLFGQTLSTPRGLVWYVPLALLVPFGVVPGWRSHPRRLLLIAGQAGLILLFYSLYAEWWAGVGWGPRFLVAIMPALVLLVAPLLARLVGPEPLWLRLPGGGILLISAFTQWLAATFNYLETEPAIADRLRAITPPTDFVPRAPMLFDPALLPWPRQIETARGGGWDVLWWQGGQPDRLLLAVCMALIAFGCVTLVLALREDRSSPARYAPLAQAGLSVALLLFVLLRLPDGPNESPGLDELTAALSGQAQPGDGIVAVLPVSFLGWLDSYDAHLPDFGFVFEDPLSEKSARLLEQASVWHSRLWLVTEGATAGDPRNGVERWLARHGFAGPEVWIEGYRMMPYAFP